LGRAALGRPVFGRGKRVRRTKGRMSTMTKATASLWSSRESMVVVDRKVVGGWSAARGGVGWLPNLTGLAGLPSFGKEWRRGCAWLRNRSVAASLYGDESFWSLVTGGDGGVFVGICGLLFGVCGLPGRRGWSGCRRRVGGGGGGRSRYRHGGGGTGRLLGWVGRKVGRKLPAE
jgi:hypothetical protein